MGRLEWCTSVARPSRRRFVWSPSSSIERVATTVVAARIRPLPFTTSDLCVARARRSKAPSPSPLSLSRARAAAFIRFREFSSTRADARPSMSRNLDASVAGMARTSFREWLCWPWLWTRPPRARDRTDRMRVRFPEGRRKGSEEALELEDGPADGGSSKPKVSGCGAGDVRWGLAHQNLEWQERALQ
jgi:hypothetical protein